MNKRGSEIVAEYILVFAGVPHRITRIVPYVHPVVTGGETWRIAYACLGPDSWGITLEPQAD